MQTTDNISHIPFNKYFLTAHHMPGSMLDAKNILISQVRDNKSVVYSKIYKDIGFPGSIPMIDLCGKEGGLGRRGTYCEVNFKNFNIAAL